MQTSRRCAPRHAHSLDLLDPTALPFHDGCDSGHLNGHEATDLPQALAIAHVANGMDPLDAALQAQLEAPLLRPWLG